MNIHVQLPNGEWPKLVIPAGPRALARSIIQEIAEQHGYTAADVTGPRRFKRLTQCRTEAAWQIARDTELSFPEMGRLLSKDHTTVIMAVRRRNEQIGANVRNLGFIPEIRVIRNKLSAGRDKAKRTLAQKMRRAELRRQADAS